MIKVAIIGLGKVAQHLASAFDASPKINLTQIYSRKSPDSIIPTTTQIINNLIDLKDADIYIIAVSDSAIAEVSSEIDFINKFVVHTSGTMPLTAINRKNKRGVFYPLQTFSKNKIVDFTTIPICLESEDDKDYEVLQTVAKAISESVYKIDSQQRKALHVAAVFANNFTNHLYSEAAAICKNNNVPFDILKPLITETAAKVQFLHPTEAQTGPAIRGDQSTIDEHLRFLKDDSQRNIYSVLTKSIQNGKKL